MVFLLQFLENHKQRVPAKKDGVRGWGPGLISFYGSPSLTFPYEVWSTLPAGDEL